MSGQYLLKNCLVGHIIPGAGVRRGGSGEKSEIFIVKFVFELSLEIYLTG